MSLYRTEKGSSVRYNSATCPPGSVLWCALLKIFLILLSAVSFLIYGVACFVSERTEQEFVLYHLSRERHLIGGLQILGATGLLLGFVYPRLGKAAAGSLALMMLLAVAVRIGIKASLLETTPALFYTGLNAYLFVKAF